MIHKNYLKGIYFFFLFSFFSETLSAHTTAYTIRNIEVIGNTHIDNHFLIGISGLKQGSIIDPSSPAVHEAMKKIAKQDGVKSAAIYLSNIDEANASATFLIDIEEYTKLSRYVIEGISKKDKEALLEKISIPQGAFLSPFFIYKLSEKIKSFFLKMGFRQTEVLTELNPAQETPGKSLLKIKIKKGEKNRVRNIIFEGNQHLDSSLLIYHMKELNTSPRFTLFKDILHKIITLNPLRKTGILFNPPKKMDEIMFYFSKHLSLSSSIFTEEKFLQAKENLINFYHTKGFRDIRIVQERVQSTSKGQLDIYLKVEEGEPYTIGNIKWAGNYIYSDQQLMQLLKLKKGSIYDPVQLKSMLSPSATGHTIFDLYVNNGYLFFNAEVVETGIEGNKIDLEIRIQEGKQATINEVNIAGNSITHDYVIRRELRTLPGEKYNNKLVYASLRNLNMLMLFKPESLIPEIDINPATNTVDITYIVKEAPRLNLNFQLGYDGRLGGTFTLGSNNVSIKNLFTGKIPAGAGQHCNLTASFYPSSEGKNFNLSFQEPWFWIKATRYILSFEVYTSSCRTHRNRLSPIEKQIFLTANPSGTFPSESHVHRLGGHISLGKKISTYWESHLGLSYCYNKYTRQYLLEDHKKRSGSLHELSMDISCYYDSTNHPYYPTEGWISSNILTLTPPYTLFTKNSEKETIPRWKQFGKLKAGFSFFQALPLKFVLNLRTYAGFLFNPFSPTIGPFERFYLGGVFKKSENGLNDMDFIPLRGYPDESLTPSNKEIKGGVLFHKMTGELRYPILLSPMCLYLVGFTDIGNCWSRYKDYNLALASIKASVGGGLRLMLPIPIIPMINIDIGYKLNPGGIKNVKSRKKPYEIHFTTGYGNY